MQQVKQGDTVKVHYHGAYRWNYFRQQRRSPAT